MNIKAFNTELIQNGNATLNVKIYSSDKPEAIILLHGGPGVPDEMIEVVTILKDQYKVITFEQRGVGLSKCQRCSFTMSDYISDIDTISKKLNIKQFHLFGHSWGGLYAQIYAKERPDKIKSLFLCSPGSGTNRTWKKTENEVVQFNKSITSKNEWLKMGWNSLLGMLGSDLAHRKLFKQVLKNYHKNYGIVEITDEFLNKIFSEPINKTRTEIIRYKPLTEFNNPDYPILITYGQNDIYGESKNELIRRFPSAKVVIIDKCGHIPWKHNRTEFGKILKEYYYQK